MFVSLLILSLRNYLVNAREISEMSLYLFIVPYILSSVIYYLQASGTFFKGLGKDSIDTDSMM